MVKRSHKWLAAVACMLCFTTGLMLAPQGASAISFGDILKVGGVGILVTQFGGEINRFINNVMSQRGIEAAGMTKVVPVVRVGTGTAIGAVQVVGPAEQVRLVQAVAEIQLEIGSIRGRALIPISTRAFYTDTVRGVDGVGVSANIQLPL